MGHIHGVVFIQGETMRGMLWMMSPMEQARMERSRGHRPLTDAQRVMQAFDHAMIVMQDELKDLPWANDYIPPIAEKLNRLKEGWCTSLSLRPTRGK